MASGRPIKKDLRHVLYNKYEEGDGFRFQEIVTPDDITSSLWGPVTANYNNSQIYEQSNMEDRLGRLLNRQQQDGCNYQIYGNMTYDKSDVVERPFSRGSSAEQREQNRTMRSLLDTVVNDGHVSNLFVFLQFSPKRSQDSQITKCYTVATLLKNVHVCINGGSPTSKKFQVAPSMLLTYLNGL